MEKVNLKDKVVLFVESSTGQYINLAIALGKSFKKVYYYTHWKSGFPKSTYTLPGFGIKGIERVLSIWEHLDEVDLFVFPDIYDGATQVYLKSLGKRVWGSGYGEELELDRYETQQYIKKIGLPYNKIQKVIGIDNLDKILKKVEDKWIKTPIYRGDFESFHHINYKLSEPFLEELSYKLGARKHIEEFLICDAINDVVEIGYDGYCIKGEFPKSSLCGIEVKDLGYIGIFKKYKDLPKEITDFNEKMKDCLKEYDYTGAMSTELRIGKDKVSTMIDFCARFPTPPSDIYPILYSNFAEIIWAGGGGECIEPTPTGKYAAEVMIYSEWATQNWLAVDYPKKYEANINLRNCCVINNQVYVVPMDNGYAEIGGIVAVGDTIDSVLKQIAEIADTVKGYQIDINLKALDTAQDEINKLTKFGIKLF